MYQYGLNYNKCTTSKQDTNKRGGWRDRKEEVWELSLLFNFSVNLKQLKKSQVCELKSNFGDS